MRRANHRWKGRRTSAALALVVAASVAASLARGSASSLPLGCDAHHLTLGPARSVSPATGEHARSFSLTYNGSRACTVSGYPTVTLLDAAGTALAFHYVHHDQYLRRVPPATLLLTRGQHAYFVIAKYRCDLGVVAVASRVAVHVGTNGSWTQPTLSERLTGQDALEYCRGGPNDPGQTVAVTAYARSLRPFAPG